MTDYSSERYIKDWSTGVLEWWSDGFETQYSNTPTLRFVARLASELFEQPAQSVLRDPARLKSRRLKARGLLRTVKVIEKGYQS